MRKQRWQYKFIRADFLIPGTKRRGKLDRIANGYVLCDGSRIMAAGAYTPTAGKRIVKRYGRQLQVLGGTRGVRCEADLVKLKGVILPGFVKGHGHDHESPLIGVAKDVPLTTWLDEAVNVFTGFMNEKRSALEKKFGKSPNLITYTKARLDDIYYGITSNMVHHCNHNKYRVDEIVEANRKAGTKMIVAVGAQDRNYDPRILDIPYTVGTERMDMWYEKYAGTERTWIIPGPDQGFSNGPELLKALKGWARRHKTLFHMHSSEEPNTTKWFRKTYKMTPVEYFAKIGILDGNTVLAHQVNNTDRDLKLLRKYNVKIVHNPLANTILGSGMPPLVRMMNMGITVAISTDGSGSADSQNMLGAARLASQYQKAKHQEASLLPADKLLEMVTAIPAKILKLNTGTLAKGKDADIIFFDTSRPNLTPSRLDNIVENLIWASDGSEVKHVIANGIVLKENYRFKTLNETRVKAEVEELASMAMAYKRRAKKVRGTGAHQ